MSGLRAKSFTHLSLFRPSAAQRGDLEYSCCTAQEAGDKGPGALAGPLSRASPRADAGPPQTFPASGRVQVLRVGCPATGTVRTTAASLESRLPSSALSPFSPPFAGPDIGFLRRHLIWWLSFSKINVGVLNAVGSSPPSSRWLPRAPWHQALPGWRLPTHHWGAARLLSSAPSARSALWGGSSPAFPHPGSAPASPCLTSGGSLGAHGGVRGSFSPTRPPSSVCLCSHACGSSLRVPSLSLSLSLPLDPVRLVFKVADMASLLQLRF